MFYIETSCCNLIYEYHTVQVNLTRLDFSYIPILNCSKKKMIKCLSWRIYIRCSKEGVLKGSFTKQTEVIFSEYEWH
jgi:hypothetical protein